MESHQPKTITSKQIVESEILAKSQNIHYQVKKKEKKQFINKILFKSYDIFLPLWLKLSLVVLLFVMMFTMAIVLTVKT